MTTDPLTQVLSLMRVSTTLFAMADLPGAWGVEFPRGDGAYFHVLDGDDGWLHIGGGPPERLRSGDVVLLAHGSPHRLTSSPDATVSVVFDPVLWEANAVVAAAAPGPAAAGRATLVCGAVDIDNPTAHPLLDALPDMLRIGRDDPSAAALELTLRLLQRETNGAGPGSQTLLARLGDVLFVQLMRVWARQHTLDTGWLGAVQDPQLGPAIAAFHADPAAAWTVASLAEAAHLSRSRFAERFTQSVGQTPLAYIAAWRLTVAADHLTSGASVAQAARQVGYSSEPAFSRAFTRHHGHPPSRHAKEALSG